MNENNNYQAAADRKLLEEHEAHPERFRTVIVCSACKSTGFTITPSGCHFCDGTESGNPPTSAPTKADIEATSNLIKAATLLGGRYDNGIIHLPCGRSVVFQRSQSLNQMWRLHPSWVTGRIGFVRQHSSPDRIARFIRAAVVKNDEEIS